MTFDTSADNFRVHLWNNGKDNGRVSCALASYSEAQRWVGWWKSAGSKFENDDLRINDSQSIGHVSDQEAA